MDKLDKLKKVLEIASRDTISATEIKDFLVTTLNVINKAKDDFKQLSSDNIQYIKDTVEYINNKYSETVSSVDHKNVSLKNELSKKIREIESKLIELDVSPEELDKEELLIDFLTKVPTVTLDDRAKIVEKINTGTKDDTKIELQQISGVDKLQENISNWALGVLDQRTQFLINKQNSAVSTGGGHTIQDEGTPLTQRTNLNFVGSSVTVTDDAGNDATVVTISGGGTIDGSGSAGTLTFWSDADTLTYDAHLTYDAVNDVLHTHKIAGDATDGLILESANGTDIGILGAANTANVVWYGAHNFDTATQDTIAGFTGVGKTLGSLSTATYPSLTELSYVKGVTSAIQTQINTKANSSGALTQFVGNGNWKVWYSDGSGDVQELALGADGTFLKSNGVAVAPSFATPAGSGDMVLASAQTNSGVKTFLDTTMKLRNVANTFDGYFVNTNTADRIYTLQDRAGTLADDTDLALKAPLASPTFTGTVTLPKTLEIQDTSANHQYVLAVSELAADRTVTLPLLGGADEFVFKDHPVTMTNKTLTSPTITTATLSGTQLLAESASIGFDPAGSADGAWSGITITGTSGYTQAFGDLVTLDKDDSRWEAVDISVAAAATGDARGIMGMVVVAGTDGNACTILLHGTIRADANFPALTIGAAVYASTTGDIVVTQPVTVDHVIRLVGYALTADSIYFNPENDWITRIT